MSRQPHCDGRDSPQNPLHSIATIWTRHRSGRISRGQIKNHEKHVLGHPASKAEIAISRISIRFGGIVFAALGIALLVNTLLNMEYGV
jgi:hypothetical protein